MRRKWLHFAFLAVAILAVTAHGSTLMADEPTSISGAGRGNWTTPQVGSDFDYARTAAPRYMLQDAPRPADVPTTTYYGATAAPAPVPVLPGSSISSGPTWPGQVAEGSMVTVPAADVSEMAAPGTTSYAEWPTDVTTEMAPEVVSEGVPCDPPAVAAAPIAAAPTSGYMAPMNPTGRYTGCGLPCTQGISEWHVRALGGVALFAGDDTPEECSFFGMDIGRTFCGCWGLDFYYRYNSGRFDREGFFDANGAAIARDGGHMHHVGLKLTYESSFGRNAPVYWYTGIGGGYFWTEDYIDDDEGAEVFFQAGIGYMITRNIRIRGGVDIIGMDTSVGRRLPANSGQSRFLWVIAPNIGLEFTF